MSTGEWEFAAVMIEIHMVPTGRVMTGRTVCAKIAIMVIILLMTRIAIHGRAFELVIYMA